MTLAKQLRIEAAGARECERGAMPEAVPIFAAMAELLDSAADYIESSDKRFAEHLEAWRVNSATSAARIAELEKQLAARP